MTPESLAGTWEIGIDRLLPALFRRPGQIQRTEAFRQVENAKSYAKWISDYRTFPNRNVERRDEYVASFCCVMNGGSNDIID
jgi:hypothetical protein